jgi:aspartate kinase
MKVFKFGGASVKDAAGIRNVCEIVNSFSDEKLLVVVSAMGKTTNALEEVVAAFHEKRDDVAKDKIKSIEAQHLETVNELFPDKKHAIYNTYPPFYPNRCLQFSL